MFKMNKPDKSDASPAIIKDITTAGPAISLATSPDTTYIPVPTQLPTPSDVRSRVVKQRGNFVTAIDFRRSSRIASIGLVLNVNGY